MSIVWANNYANRRDFIVGSNLCNPTLPPNPCNPTFSTHPCNTCNTTISSPPPCNPCNITVSRPPICNSNSTKEFVGEASLQFASGALGLTTTVLPLPLPAVGTTIFLGFGISQPVTSFTDSTNVIIGGYSVPLPFHGILRHLTISLDANVLTMPTTNGDVIFTFTVFRSNSTICGTSTTPATNPTNSAEELEEYKATKLRGTLVIPMSTSAGPVTAVSLAPTISDIAGGAHADLVVLAGNRIAIGVSSNTTILATNISPLSFNASLTYVVVCPT